jgi:hypothetical protein
MVFCWTIGCLIKNILKKIWKKTWWSNAGMNLLFAWVS